MIIKKVDNIIFMDEFKRDKSSRFIENQKKNIFHDGASFLLSFITYLLICRLIGTIIIYRLDSLFLYTILTFEVVIVVIMLMIAIDKLSRQIRGMRREFEKRKFVYFIRVNHLTKAMLMSSKSKYYIIAYAGVKYQKCIINVNNQSSDVESENTIIQIKNSTTKFTSLEAWKEGESYVQVQKKNGKKKESCI